VTEEILRVGVPGKGSKITRQFEVSKVILDEAHMVILPPIYQEYPTIVPESIPTDVPESSVH
jgi:hypothetical protein